MPTYIYCAADCVFAVGCGTGYRNQKSTETGSTLEEQYKDARDTAMDESFWEHLEGAVKVMSPVASLLRLADSDAPTASKIQYLQYEVQEQLKAVDLSFLEDEDEAEDIRQELVSIHRGRWDYSFTPVQGTGYLLDPEYWDMQQHDDPEVMAAFYTMVQKTYFLPTELPIDATLEAKQEHERRSAAQVELQGQAERELSNYRNKVGVLGRPVCVNNAKSMPACEWWMSYGSELPALQKVAVRCLGQISGAGAAERGHKEMNFIKSKVRNRMGIEKMEDYVYVRHNLNQIQKIESIHYAGSGLIHWSDGVPEGDNEDWQDAWQEARDEEEEEFEEHRHEGDRRAAARATRIHQASVARIAPASAQTTVDGGAVLGATSTRAGRVVRRPGNLADFAS
jgi:hypothetical protein